MPEYTTTEIAALCKVSERTIQRWMKEGRLPAQELKRNLFHVTDEDIAKVQPRGIAPPENARIALLEHRVGELEDRLGMIEHLYTLEHKTTSQPLQPQIGPSESDTLPDGYIAISDLIEQYGKKRQRQTIMRHMKKWIHTGHWKRAGHAIEKALDQEGRAEFLRRYVTQA